jgi:TPR repeat protein
MKAYNNLGTVYAKLKNMEKAAYYWEFAAKSGIQPAIRNLINYYKKRDNAKKVDEWTKKLK